MIWPGRPAAQWSTPAWIHVPLQSALQHLLDGHPQIELGDQDALNLVLWQSWTALAPVWNYQRKFLYDDHKSPLPGPPKIIHFTETAKPWQRDEWHPLAWLYWKHLRATPFFAQVRAEAGVGWMRLLKFWLKYRLSRI